MKHTFFLTFTSATLIPFSAFSFSGIEVSESAFELPDLLREKADAVGSLRVFPLATTSTKQLSCTAAHIGNGLVLTAGHCFLGARSCNSSYVIFGSRKNRPVSETTFSKCEEVVAVVSDESRLGSSGEDFALFRVSNPPKEFFEINVSSRPSSGSAKLALLSYPIFKSSWNAPSLFYSGPCEVRFDSVATSSGRVKPAQTFSHSCSGSGGSNGGPLIDLNTMKLSGIYTSAFPDSPLEQGTQNASSSFLAKAFSGLHFQKLFNLSVQTEPLKFPKAVRSGFFAPEVFPSGFPLNLNFELATLPNIQTYVSFRVRRTSDTRVTLQTTKDSIVLANMPRSEEVFKLKTPVTVRAAASKGSTHFSAEVLDISFSED